MFKTGFPGEIVVKNSNRRVQVTRSQPNLLQSAEN